MSFELIQGDRCNPVYAQQVAQHLVEVRQFNEDDRLWVAQGRWDYTTDLKPVQWLDPEYMPTDAAKRLQYAWDLGENGKKLCLAGVLNLMLVHRAILYTPHSVRFVNEFLPGEFPEESQDAVNYNLPEQPQLRIVS